MASNQDIQWPALESLWERLQMLHPHPPSPPHSQEELTRVFVERCEKVVADVVAALAAEEAPLLRVPRTLRSDGLGSSGESLVSLGNPRGARRFALVLHTLSQAYANAVQGSVSTRRDVFYGSVQLYGSQAALDR